MKKAFDQTVRDLKREVNKKVLKVPSIEQKILDATSNEPWGPHGTLLADIAQATRNYNEYQMIMGVIWKRINDTGKNWRHVYKALTALEYLVAHGSERVIDEIREHAYQIQTLSDFQYIDSTGRDQGSNVRKKSQSLVMLVNDKDRIHEVRQKAATNRDKFRTTSLGNMYRPGSYSSSIGYGDRYDDDRFDGRHGSRDEERNGYGREREYGYRDDDRYGRYGEPYGRDGERYGRRSEPYIRDDESRGRSRSVDKYEYGSRSRSSDRNRDHTYEDDGQYASSSVGRGHGRKYSEQNLGAPPSYEEVVGPARSPTHSVRDGETSSGSAPKPSSPTASASPTQTTRAAAPPPASASPTQATSTAARPPVPPSPAPVAVNNEPDSFDEFDPRGSLPAAPITSSVAAPITSRSAEIDLLGSLSEAFTSNSLALVPVTPVEAASEVDTSTSSASGPTYAAATSASFVSNQTFDDPFGDGPFKAIPSTNDSPGERQSFSTSDGTFPGGSYTSSNASNVQNPQPNTHSPQELSTSDQSIDILADILPPTGPQQHLVNQSASVTGFPTSSGQNFPAQLGQHVIQAGFYAQGQFPSMTSFPTQMAQHHPSVSGFPSHQGPSSQAAFQTLPGGRSAQSNTVSYGGYDQQMVPHASNILLRSGSGVPVASQTALPAAQLASGPNFMASQSAPPAATGFLANDKFETKSTVWADTLSRGLVNLNISGPKTNPTSDIGIDFDALNRKEKRMHKPSTTPVISTITMGKAMGSGSGMGRAGAGPLRPPSNSMMGAGMGMGMGMGGGPRPGMGMGGYAGMNQQMGMNTQANMGMQMGMNMGVGGQMQQPTGFPPGSNIRQGYNPMMGGPPSHGQQPYGGGYR